MGFNVQGGKEAPIDEAKVAGRIESQLQGLRDLYRQETSKNSALMGGLVLQLTVSSSGKVTKVREITSRIGDNDFRTAVIADAWTWSFDQVLIRRVHDYLPAAIRARGYGYNNFNSVGKKSIATR